MTQLRTTRTSPTGELKNLLAARYHGTMPGMRFSHVLVLLAGVSLPVSGGLAYWCYRTSPDQMLHRGLTELDRGLAEEAEGIAESLEERGHVDHARMLRGEIWRRSGVSLASTAAGGAAETARSARARQ